MSEPRFSISRQDMGGWVRVHLGHGEPTGEVAQFLSHSLSLWMREPLEDVIDYFRFCTSFDNFNPHHYLALILGGDDKMAQMLCSSLKIGFGPYDRTD